MIKEIQVTISINAEGNSCLHIISDDYATLNVVVIAGKIKVDDRRKRGLPKMPKDIGLRH